MNNKYFQSYFFTILWAFFFFENIMKANFWNFHCVIFFHLKNAFLFIMELILFLFSHPCMTELYLIYCLPLVNILRLSEVICLTQDFYLWRYTAILFGRIENSKGYSLWSFEIQLVFSLNQQSYFYITY